MVQKAKACIIILSESIPFRVSASTLGCFTK